MLSTIRYSTSIACRIDELLRVSTRVITNTDVARFSSLNSLFTKILVPYGRYLGYWKSHEEYVGGLICVRLNGSDGAIIGEKIDAVNESVNANQLFFGEEEDNEDDASLKPVYIRTKLFTIDSLARQIRFDDDDAPDRALPWRKTFASDQQYFGLSQEALPANERSSVISYEPGPLEDADRRDIYFTKACSNGQMIVYRPLAIPEPSTDHPLARFNGIWVGSYGGHGLELLHLEVSDHFNGPTIVDGEATEGVPMALVATKISGDNNVPHRKISFAALRPIETQSDSPTEYEGIGQSKTHFYTTGACLVYSHRF